MRITVAASLRAGKRRDHGLPLRGVRMTNETVMPPMHPGEVLAEEYLEPLGITQHRVAVAVGDPSTASAGSRLTQRCGWSGSSGPRNGSGSTCSRATTWNSRRTSWPIHWPGLSPSPAPDALRCRGDSVTAVLVKWVSCEVTDRPGFDRGQRAWSGLAGVPGFLGQSGGW